MSGKGIKMIDVSGKGKTHRTAVASGIIRMNKETFRHCVDKTLPKGDVFSCSEVAAYMAAKNTSATLPLCHPIRITHVDVTFGTDVEGKIIVEVKVEGFDRTGVEMEALNAVSVALMNIYDMCKMLDKDMVITDIMLLEKTGGKTGNYKRM